MADETGDPDKDISALFKLLQGDLSQDQIEVYDVMNKASSDLVTTEQSSDVEMAEDYDDEDDDNEDNDKGTSSKSQVAVSSKSAKDKRAEITTTYINGEISLDEVMTLLEEDSEVTETPESTKEAEVSESYKGTKEGEDFERELNSVTRRQFGRRHKRLPKHLLGLMGEANLKLARGDHEEAIKMCMEIVRLAPTATEPFQTLGMLYEELGQLHKSFQFYLIGAYLSPSNLEEWVRLAEIAVEQGYQVEALKCYSKAIKLDPKNTSLILEKANLHKALGERKKALDGFLSYLSHVNEPDQGEVYLKLSREIAMCFHEESCIDLGIKAMKDALEKYCSDITSEDVNLLLELLLAQKSYFDALEALIKYCGIQIISDNPDHGIENMKDEISKEFHSCRLPEILPIDLRVKLAVCIIHLKGMHLVKEILEPLSSESSDEMGDLYLDIAEAFIEIGEYYEALPYLSSLASSDSYNVAGVWLKYGECLNAIGDIDRAVSAYKTVVTLAPGHSAARISLSSSLQQLGRTAEALMTLSHEKEAGEVMDLQILLQKCTLLYSQKMYEEFIKAAKIIISSNMEKLNNVNEVECIFPVMSLKNRIETLREHRTEWNIPLSTIDPDIFTENTIAPEELWNLHLKVCSLLYDLKRYNELEEWSLAVLMNPTFHRDLRKGNELKMMSIMATFINEHWDYTYVLVKNVCVQKPNCNRVWNMLSYVANKTRTVRHNKFCIRLSFKHQSNISLSLLNGHSALVAGSYKHALGEYMNVFKEKPNEPFVILCIAIVMTSITAQKFTANKNSLVIQVFSFLNQYMEVRGACQESYYNLGRAMHGLGFWHAAIFYYKKVFETPCSINSDEETKETFNLQREAAFNLSLIYQRAGSLNLAKYYISRFCVI